MNDLTNRTFGQLKALRPEGKKGSFIAWLCSCTCGKTKVISSNSLTMGNTKSCGCLQRYKQHPVPQRKIKKPGAALFYQSRVRAKAKGIANTLTLEDIIIPEFCPVLGIKLEQGKGSGGRIDSSPSIDRIDTSKGYTPDNIKIISWRANKLKSNSSIEEMEAILNYMKEHDTGETQIG